MNSISNPVIRIDLLPYEVKRSSDQYKKALASMEDITGVLRVTVHVTVTVTSAHTYKKPLHLCNGLFLFENQAG